MPRSPVAKHQPLRLKLWPLRIKNVAEFAVVVAHSRLLDVEAIEARRERVPETVHVALRVERLPRSDASLALAGFEHEEKRV